MKVCKDCNEVKHASLFYGVQNECKECTKRRVRNNKADYDKTQKGVIRVIYKTQRSNSKRRNHSPPSYTKKELSEFLYSHGFIPMFNQWVSSGYEKDSKPSVDRVNDLMSYSIDNIRLTTWGENRRKQYLDILNGTGTSGKRCKGVYRVSSNGDRVFYVSYSSAERENNLCNGVISASMRRGTRNAGGFLWERVD